MAVDPVFIDTNVFVAAAVATEDQTGRHQYERDEGLPLHRA